MSTSMGTRDCEGCNECNTTYAGNLDHHLELQPHDWGTRYHQNTGKPFKYCKKCHTIDAESYKTAQVK